MERSQFTQKELQVGIKKMMSARVQQFGVLTSADVMAMLGVAGYDGALSQTEYEEIVQVSSQYADRFDNLGLALIQGLIQQLQKGGKGGSYNQQPASQPTPSARTDPKLVGRWNHMKYYSAGTYSSTVSRDMVLHGDGHFEENGSVGANLRVTDAGGNWEGTTSAYSGANPGEYGRWEAQNGILTLHYADNTYCQYRYSVSGKPGDRGLITRSARGKELFWKEY